MQIQSVKALVPMKHHSERVRGKNLRLLADRPLFYWILESLSRSEYVEEIIINTDSEEIAENARKNFDVTILERPEYLLGDMITIQPLIKYDLSQTDGEHYLQTHSTNPLLTTETINHAVETYFALKEQDSLFTVTALQTRFYWPDGRSINHDPENLIRTQDLKPIYEENSCVYLFSRTGFHRWGNRIGERPKLLPMNRLEAIDIDDETDFLFAEHLMNLRLQSKR